MRFILTTDYDDFVAISYAPNLAAAIKEFTEKYTGKHIINWNDGSTAYSREVFLIPDIYGKLLALQYILRDITKKCMNKTMGECINCPLSKDGCELLDKMEVLLNVVL